MSSSVTLAILPTTLTQWETKQICYTCTGVPLKSFPPAIFQWWNANFPRGRNGQAVTELVAKVFNQGQEL